MPELPALMTTAEVASALRITRQTVHRWVTEGRLTPVPWPSRQHRFRREDIETILRPVDAA